MTALEKVSLLLLPLVSFALPDALPDVANALMDASGNILGYKSTDLFEKFYGSSTSSDSDDDDEEDPGPFFDRWEDEEAYYGPTDRFWSHSAATKTLLLGGFDYYPTIDDCLTPELSSEEWQQVQQPQNLTRQVSERFIDRKGRGPIVLVAIENSISPLHARALQALEKCVRLHVPRAYETRPLYEVYQDALKEATPEERESMGGNSPTSLHTLVSLFLPTLVDEIYETLQMAFDAAGWQSLVSRDEVLGYSRAFGKQGLPQNLGLRAAEYLRYDGFAALGEHDDGWEANMVLTLMLEDDYRGGEFYIYDAEDEVHEIRPKKHSALIFKGGNFIHGLRKIEGKREAFSLEFWNYPDLPFGSNLCAAEAGNMEEHINQCNPIQRGEYDTKACDKAFPNESTYGVCHSSWVGSAGTSRKFA